MAGVDACKLKYVHTHLANASGMGKLCTVGATLIMLLAFPPSQPSIALSTRPFTHSHISPQTPKPSVFSKLAYFVAFGPHGPRTPANEPGHSLKVVVGVVALVGAAYGVFALARSQGTFPFFSLDPYPIPFWLPVSVGTSLNWAVGLVWRFSYMLIYSPLCSRSSS